MARCPEVGSCCCCFSLRTGSAIFGVISLLLSFLFALVSAAELIMGSFSDDEKTATSNWILGGDVAVQSMQTIMAIVMLLGVCQENGKLLKPWLVTTIIVAIAELSFLPTIFDRLIFVDVLFTYGWTRFLINLVFIIDDVYGFIVVYSYYCTLSPGGHVV